MGYVECPAGLGVLGQGTVFVFFFFVLVLVGPRVAHCYIQMPTTPTHNGKNIPQVTPILTDEKNFHSFT